MNKIIMLLTLTSTLSYACSIILIEDYDITGGSSIIVTPIDEENVLISNDIDFDILDNIETKKDEANVTEDLTDLKDTITIPISQTKEDKIVELYIANFHRAPDADGLKYWVEDSNLTIEDIAISFYEQPETKETYPEGYSTIDFVTEVYSNLFGRYVEQSGLDYWVEEIDSGSIHKSKFILAVINGAFGQDKITMGKKRYAGLEFVRSKSNDTDQARMAIQDIDLGLDIYTGCPIY